MVMKMSTCHGRSICGRCRWDRDHYNDRVVFALSVKIVNGPYLWLRVMPAKDELGAPLLRLKGGGACL